MVDLAKYLFPIHRSLTGAGIDKCYEVFQHVHPEFSTLSFPTGSKVFDWEIPPVWSINDAFIEHESGKRYCQISANNLHVVGYSMPVDVTLSLDSLMPYLHSREDLPSAIPYLTSYYSRRWGFCISHEELLSLPPGDYRCYIDSSFSSGTLNLIEAVIPGDSSEEIFFSSYLCHPSMANNELSGPVLLSEIMKYIKDIPNRTYTYRFVLLPETIGSIAYLSVRKDELKRNVIAGFNLSCVGDERRFTHLMSKKGDTLADQALSSALNGRANVVTKTFASRGSDERQYNSPGIDLPVCGFSRSKFGDYPEYHTSLDDFNVVTQDGLKGSFDVFQDLIDAFECGLFPRTTVFCEPQLGKRGLYPNLSAARASTSDDRKITNLTIRSDVLSYSDGTVNIFQLPGLAGCPLSNVVQELNILSKHGLISFD